MNPEEDNRDLIPVLTLVALTLTACIIGAGFLALTGTPS